jgi:hypothetical protein
MGASDLEVRVARSAGNGRRRPPGPAAALFGASGYATTATTPAVERVSTGPAIRTPPRRGETGCFLWRSRRRALGYTGAQFSAADGGAHGPQRDSRHPRGRSLTARIPVTLPNGQTLSLAPGPASPSSPRSWGARTRRCLGSRWSPLNFQSDTTNVTPESLLDRERPRVRAEGLPVDGRRGSPATDNTGAADANLALSTSRSRPSGACWGSWHRPVAHQRGRSGRITRSRPTTRPRVAQATEGPRWSLPTSNGSILIGATQPDEAAPRNAPPAAAPIAGIGGPFALRGAKCPGLPDVAVPTR